MALTKDVISAIIERLEKDNIGWSSWNRDHNFSIGLYKKYTGNPQEVKFTPYAANIYLEVYSSQLLVRVMGPIFMINSHDPYTLELKPSYKYYAGLGLGMIATPRQFNANTYRVDINALYKLPGQTIEYARKQDIFSQRFDDKLLGKDRGTTPNYDEGIPFRNRKVKAKDVVNQLFDNIIIPCGESITQHGSLGLGSHCDSCSAQFNCMNRGQ